MNHIDELFSEWQRTQASAAELCRDAPHLLDELQARILNWQSTRPFNSPTESVNVSPIATDASPIVGPDLRHPAVDVEHISKPPTTRGDDSGQSNSHSTIAQAPVRADSTGTWLANRYRLTRMLGRGGFGEVWHADDMRLQRCVAIKIPRPDRVFTDERRRQFLAEARKAAGLHHPNIVPIHDIGEATHWHLVSEYIDGTSLAEKIDRERLSYQECAQLMATIAEALHFAHRKDLVHRDVKPANILLDQTGKPYLTDFGLAVSECELLVEPPLALGTWAYMSPEQARGESHLVDARSDIYSLGVVLYRLLTGRLPFMAADSAAYRKQILERPVRPPRTIDDRIPAPLEDICLKCLRKERDDRYKTAKDVAEDLTAWLKPKHVQPRRWWPAAVVATCAAMMLLIVVLTTGGSRSQLPAESIPPFDEAEVDIKPNVPYSLLRWKPRQLSFSGADSKLDWDSGKPMLVHSTGYGLIALGNARRPGYEIRVTLRQEKWTGDIGVFLGYGVGHDKGGAFATYQFFEIIRPLENDPSLVINHIQARDYDLARLGRPFRDPLGAAGLPTLHPKYYQFALTVDHKGVHDVQWDGKPVPGLGNPSGNAVLQSSQPSTLTGDFGLYTGPGTTSIQNFEVKFQDSYFKDGGNR